MITPELTREQRIEAAAIILRDAIEELDAADVAAVAERAA